MRARRRTGIAFGMTLLLMLQAGLAMAADCMQGHAVYTDSEKTYEIVFEPVDSDAASSSHRFTMTVRNTDLVLDGYVMPSEPVDRPNGMLFFHCPDGDVTGDDLRACTIWQGIIYTHDDGKIGLLPASGNKAAAEILLPGLGSSIRDSSLWETGKLSVTPWDVLTFKECR